MNSNIVLLYSCECTILRHIIILICVVTILEHGSVLKYSLCYCATVVRACGFKLILNVFKYKLIWLYFNTNYNIFNYFL